MCYAGRLWVGKIAAAVDCSSPLERSNVAEELSAIVRVVRVVEEVLGEGANTPDQNNMGATFGEG